ncbi:MAG: DUF4405 domain-containing protein [Dehalococcoidia bacterium]
MLNRPKINFILDALMFLCASAVGGTGFLIRYDLITGRERWDKYATNVELSFWGMDRHEWGQIHLVLIFILMGLLALHIILHWDMIPGLWRKLIGRQKVRWIIATVFIAAALLLLLFPFMVDPKVGAGGQGEGRGVESQTVAIPTQEASPGQTAAPATATEITVDIKGFMLLSEVAKTYNVPAEYLKEKLSIPQTESAEQRLGWLATSYGFTMSKVEGIVIEYLR